MPVEYYNSLKAAAQRWKAFRNKGYISEAERRHVLLPVLSRWIPRLCEVEKNCLAGTKRFNADFAKTLEETY
ncbi:MAG: hypothetical protein IKU86_00270 [Thermoguttaceae bacterium]|nr:hypothetical protein [Thermoguttaceae bacterium]